MKITVEISMYPLNEKYEMHILDFIKRLNMHTDIQVKTNATATHILGDYDAVFQVLQKELRVSFEKEVKFVIVTKIINAGLTI